MRLSATKEFDMDENWPEGIVHGPSKSRLSSNGRRWGLVRKRGCQ